jgi:hypothetical protein
MIGQGGREGRLEIEELGGRNIGDLSGHRWALPHLHILVFQNHPFS